MILTTFTRPFCIIRCSVPYESWGFFSTQEKQAFCEHWILSPLLVSDSHGLFALFTLDVLVFLFPKLNLLNFSCLPSSICHSPPCTMARNSLKEVRWYTFRAFLVCFPFLRDVSYHLLMSILTPDVLKTIFTIFGLFQWEVKFILATDRVSDIFLLFKKCS